MVCSKYNVTLFHPHCADNYTKIQISKPLTVNLPAYVDNSLLCAHGISIDGIDWTVSGTVVKYMTVGKSRYVR
ncbi:MAG: hypothetical protein J07HQW1_00123 [Haloquadratum walsbyi J07HQW1]|uniref:Uncharacterized protein n=1 Tax=Haloquadratum walsbyi J07HQW1 TaxID=1238424 RepID=U1N0W7_9EURY|nr:MAG: hypothetical protein J07HQW1_00123 [Haloquadratum walsbyi J07HQW1]